MMQLAEGHSYTPSELDRIRGLGIALGSLVGARALGPLGPMGSATPAMGVESNTAKSAVTNNAATANAVAMRTNVLSNIADSQAARASSNFSQFSKIEGQLQESLGIWPPNSGGYAPVPNITLDVGTKLDRYGFPRGNFVSPQGASFGERALPSAYETTKPYFQYEVV